jgi:Na+-translocating ferredoxin:NAD+ oxidoreductase RnfA subunit
MYLLTVTDGQLNLCYADTLNFPAYFVYEMLLLGLQLRTWRRHAMLRLCATNVMYMEFVLSKKFFELLPTLLIFTSGTPPPSRPVPPHKRGC